MANQYQTDGICFSYPADWQLHEEHGENQTSVDLAGPATASCSVVLLRDCPDPEPAVEAVVDAFRDEYEDIDRYEIHEEITNRPSVGCDLEFIYYELCNSVSLRAFQAGGITVLLICQANSDDLEVAQAAFKRICESIDCDGDPVLDG